MKVQKRLPYQNNYYATAFSYHTNENGVLSLKTILHFVVFKLLTIQPPLFQRCRQSIPKLSCQRKGSTIFSLNHHQKGCFFLWHIRKICSKPFGVHSYTVASLSLLFSETENPVSCIPNGSKNSFFKNSPKLIPRSTKSITAAAVTGLVIE